MPTATSNESTPRDIERRAARRMRTRTLLSIDEVAPAEWNALAADTCPFLRHEFLAALEHQHCVGPGTGWAPVVAGYTRLGDDGIVDVPTGGAKVGEARVGTVVMQ